MISSILTNPAIYNITQTTQAQVAIETGLKAVGRPGFILMDKSIDKNTKKYSATKEFLYQLTCIALSLGVVIPIFKKGSFSIAKKVFKDEPVFKMFKNSDEFNKFYNANKENRVGKLRDMYAQKSQNYSDDELNRHIHLAKGMIETTSIAGSVLGLSIMAPLVSRPFIRPIINKMFSNPKDDNNPQPQKVDVKA
jgi:hypothetical protein